MMRLNAYPLAAVITLGLICAAAPASAQCNRFVGATLAEVNANLLTLIDESMVGWAHHDSLKRIMSPTERLEAWQDTRDAMRARCALGDEFGAGLAFGQMLGVYRMGLIEAFGAPDQAPREAPPPRSRAASERWRGDVYPDKTKLAISELLGTFPSLEECRAAARRRLNDLGASERGSYECGKNCRPLFPELADSVHVCEETLR